jgi:hypothetical protein
VPGAELADDRQDCVFFGLVSLKAADLEREALPVDQQADHDLRIDPAFFGVADLAQPVLVLRLEVERRDVAEHQRDVAAGQHVGEAQPGEPVTVVPVEAAAQCALARGQARRDPAHLCQHPVRIQQAGRLDHPGDHQVTEHLITQRAEPEIRIHPGQHVIQQARRRLQRPHPRHHRPGTRRRPAAEQHRPARGRDHRGLPGLRSDPEIENALPVVLEQAPRLLHEQPELRLVAGRAHMPHDPAPAPHRLRDLHSGRPRCGTHPPNPSHQQSLRARLVP